MTHLRSCVAIFQDKYWNFTIFGVLFAWRSKRDRQYKLIEGIPHRIIHLYKDTLNSLPKSLKLVEKSRLLQSFS
jgi:hypothetical protein